MRHFFCGLSLLAASSALADQVIQAEASISPQIMQNDSGYIGCGVRVLFFTIDSTSGDVSGGDFSLMLYGPPKAGGALKAGGIKCGAPCSPSDKDYVHGTDYRLSTVASGVPLKLGQPFPGDDPRFSMAVTGDIVGTVQLQTSLIRGERVQMAFQPDGVPARVTYQFAANPMPKEDVEAYTSCMRAIVTKTTPDNPPAK